MNYTQRKPVPKQQVKDAECKEGKAPELALKQCGSNPRGQR